MTSPNGKPGPLQRLANLFDPVALRDAAEQAGRSPLSRFLLHQIQAFIFTARSIVREEVTLRAAA